MKVLEKAKLDTDTAIGAGIGFGITWFGAPIISGFVGQNAWLGGLGLAIVFYLMGYGYMALGALFGTAALFLSGRGSQNSGSGGFTIV